MNHHPDTIPFEYSHIADGIYIGTNQCCKTHFDDMLQAQGIEADISLEDTRVDRPFGVSMYIWIPTKNHDAPTSTQLTFGVETLQSLVKLNKKVYVH